MDRRLALHPEDGRRCDGSDSRGRSTKVLRDLGCRGVVIMAQADCSGLWELENESSEHSHLSCATAGTLSVS